jgi:hypothetical protein
MTIKAMTEVDDRRHTIGMPKMQIQSSIIEQARQ